jgi:cytochrome c-type biogenesis protein CcmH
MLILLYSLIGLLLLSFLSTFAFSLWTNHRSALLMKPYTELWLVGAMLFLFSISAIFLYGKWGAYQALGQFYAMSDVQAQLQTRKIETSQIQTVIAQFVHYLKTHPQDTKGWFLLGRLYLDQGNVKNAADAFKHSFDSDVNKNSEVTAQYAQALYFLHKQTLNEESLKLVQLALSQDPQNRTALNLLAMDAFSHHRYALALTYWKRLRSQYVEESAEFQTLSKAMTVCEKKMRR